MPYFCPINEPKHHNTMNTTKHTPGPWMFRHYEWGNNVSDDFGVFHDNGIGAGHHVANVAKIYQGERQPEVEQANASLIAAAPELLEALIEVMAALDSAVDNDFEYPTAKRIGRAAIAKATNA